MITPRSSLLLLLATASLVAKHTTEVTSQEQFNTLIQDKKRPVAVVKFHAPWCGHCKKIKTPFEQLAKEEEFKQVIFAEVEGDNNQDLVAQYKITGYPTFFIFERGEPRKLVVDRSSAESFKQDMRAEINKSIQNTKGKKVASKTKKTSTKKTTKKTVKTKNK